MTVDARLFDTDCGQILRRAEDRGVIYLQRCLLPPGHAGPCSPSRWHRPDEAA